MTRILIHPYAGVLSAYGMGLAEVCAIRQATVEEPLGDSVSLTIQERLQTLEMEARSEAIDRGAETDRLQVRSQVYLRYSGTDTALDVDYGNVDTMAATFADRYRQRYGFVMTGRDLVIEAIAVEVRNESDLPPLPSFAELSHQEIAIRSGPWQSMETVAIYGRGGWQDAKVYQRATLQPGDEILGPALILESTGTTVLESGWTARIGEGLHLILEQSQVLESKISLDTQAVGGASQHGSPVQLEIFHNLFRSIAEEMGIALQNTSYSVNIKERLDFSCAIFDQQGHLVANAPHIPVHLGSMGASVTALMRAKQQELRSGNVYISNNPYNGGTHLPDITAITPVFSHGSDRPVFYLAARGHHADIGGITPGSMPPDSTTIDQEGILFDNWLLVEGGQLRERELLEYLAQGGARSPRQNLGDLQAQVAANERGKAELLRVVERYGLDYVQAYMQHIQDRGELAVRRAIDRLQNGSFTYQTDEGSQIQVKITIDPERRCLLTHRLAPTARIDFTGTSPQQPNNFNAPLAICHAVVLYVFRTLVADDIPLNAGCLKPLEIIVPEGCLLNPVYPAAVVAGNVETSQAIVNALYGALGNMAAAQGTMNNLIFGNDRYQYYETIAGGSGAGPGFAGADGVQTHMTNSRLTDPEVLELRFPVLLEEFAIRANSGGQGQYRGGHGTVRRLCFLEPMTAGILSSSRLVPPFGLAGGEAGAVGRNLLLRQDGTVEVLGSRARVEMSAGDQLVIETPGGGGWGTATRDD
jgi:5-oxoprolinase (ATP-hydrolysing)